jgi:ssDNA-specific exonuclease RecJ
LFYPSSRNVANELIVAPAPDADLSEFKTVVFLDTPSDFHLESLKGKTVYYNAELCGYKLFKLLDTERETLLEIYGALRRDVNLLNGETAEEIATACDALGFEKRQFIFALKVFEELGLVAFGDGKLTVYRGVKAELSNSTLYEKVRAVGEEA